MLKFAVIGVGTWGECHVAVYNQHPLCEVVAVCDSSRDRANAVAQKYGVENVYTDYNQMLAECKLDCVAVVTPDFAHAEPAIACANAGVHILLEKPIATTAEDTQRILEAVERNGVRCMVDLHNRWNPPFVAAKDAILRGELGDVYSAYFRLNDCVWVATDMLKWTAQSSILWFLGSHSLDTLRYLFDDEVVRVYSVSRKGILQQKGVDVEDCYYTTLEFSRGGVAHMENGFVTPNGNPNVNDIKCNILGTKGMVSIDATHHGMCTVITENKVTVPDVLVNNYTHGYPAGFAYASIRTFVECIHSGADFPVSLTDARNTTLTLLAVMESAKTRMPVEVRL